MINRDVIDLDRVPSQHDRDELRVVIPHDLSDDSKHDLFSKVMVDVINTIKARENSKHPKKKIVIGCEPEFNADRAEELAAFLRDALPMFGIALEIEARDLMPEIGEALAKRDAERTRLDETIKSVIAGIAGALGGSLIPAEDDDDRFTTASGKDDCGCLYCVMRRRVTGRPEPINYAEGKAPADVAKLYTPEEWRELDALHASLVRDGALPADDLRPSAAYGGRPAGVN